MAYTIPAVNTTGVDVILTEVSTQVPIFIPFLLLFIYVVAFMTIYRKQSQTSSGGGDAPLCMTIAGIITSIVALILSQGEGIINLLTLVTTFGITIASAIWLFSSGDRQ